MGGARVRYRFAGALAVSGALHAWLLATLPGGMASWHVERALPVRPVPLSVVLQPAVSDPEPQSPLAPDREAVADAPPAEPRAPSLAEVAPLPERPPSPPTGPKPEVEPISPPTLNLARPESFGAPATPSDETEQLLQAFRPALQAGVRARDVARAREALVRRRQVATTGLSVDAYNALERPGSRHMKTAQGCFTLRSAIVGEMAGAGEGLRWYRTACKDLLENPFQLPALETDALGRAVPPDSGVGR